MGEKSTKVHDEEWIWNTDVQKGFLPKISGCIEHNHTVVDLLKQKINSSLIRSGRITLIVAAVQGTE